MNNKRILIADGNGALVDTLAEIFAIKGYLTTPAKSGIVALSRAQSLSPDLILCDTRLPRMNGIELYARLRSKLITQHIPLIFFITAKIEAQYLRSELQIPATHIVYKPFDVDEVIMAAEGALGKFGWMQPDYV